MDKTPSLFTPPQPLAARLRPRSLKEFVGQEHLVGPGRLLWRALKARRLFSSMIFWGPPGSGKTTLARALARVMDAQFASLSAVMSGVPDLRKVVEEARRWQEQGRRTILLIDEIHRFNKAQQDALLPHVEEGLLTLIGATTENPYFEIIGPLLSRARIFVFEPLTEANLLTLLRRALTDKDQGLGAMHGRGGGGGPGSLCPDGQRRRPPGPDRPGTGGPQHRAGRPGRYPGGPGRGPGVHAPAGPDLR